MAISISILARFIPIYLSVQFILICHHKESNLVLILLSILIYWYWDRRKRGLQCVRSLISARRDVILKWTCFLIDGDAIWTYLVTYKGLKVLPQRKPSKEGHPAYFSVVTKFKAKKVLWSEVFLTLDLKWWRKHSQNVTSKSFLCRLRSIAAHWDHFVRRLSVCLSVYPSIR